MPGEGKPDQATLASHLESFLPRIRLVLPDLEIHFFKVNTDGLANEVVVINDEIAFRFAKGDYGRESLKRELQVLEALRGQLEISLPDPFYTSEDTMAYRFLPGEPLTRQFLAGLHVRAQQALADQLAGFLKAMHAIRQPSLPKTLAPVDLERLKDQRQRARQQVYPLLLSHQVEWAEGVYAYLDQPGAFVYEPGLVHGDLASYHLLVDSQRGSLSGVIDFGVAGLGDPASDLGALLQNYGLGFVKRLEMCYPRAIDFLPRARFYAQAIGCNGCCAGWNRVNRSGSRRTWAVRGIFNIERKSLLMPTAILSVYDKTGLVDFGRGLARLGWSLLASGGTARLLQQNDLPVTEVADYTHSPEILGGRVKTLHPAIHGGLLARATESDLAEIEALGWGTIDLAAVNLYPFERTIAQPDVSLEEAIENIDIGGVALIRAAAKNHARVTLVCDPADYTSVLTELNSGGLSAVTRRRLAVKGFSSTAHYDTAISNYLKSLPEGMA